MCNIQNTLNLNCFSPCISLPWLFLHDWIAFSFHSASVQFSHSVMSDSLRPHELQHARPPCPSLTPRVHSNSCPLSQWCPKSLIEMQIKTAVWSYQSEYVSSKRECWEKGTLLHCWWESKLLQPLWRTVWKSPKKLKTSNSLNLSHITGISSWYPWLIWLKCHH